MKKPSLASVVLEEESPKEESADKEESTEGYSASVDELFDALKANDRDAFSEAFKAAVMSCK